MEIKTEKQENKFCLYFAPWMKGPIFWLTNDLNLNCLVAPINCCIAIVYFSLGKKRKKKYKSKVLGVAEC